MKTFTSASVFILDLIRLPLLGILLTVSLWVHAQPAATSGATLASAEEAVLRAEREYGPDHLATAETLHSLGVLYRQTERYTQALPMFERAFDIRNKKLGSADSATRESLFALAEVHNKAQQPEKAAPLYARALAMAEASSNPERDGLLESLNGLAYAANELGEYAKALTLYERALSLQEARLGKIRSALPIALMQSAIRCQC